MKARSRLLLRRSVFLAAIGVLVAVLTACTGRGGGYLPPERAFRCSTARRRSASPSAASASPAARTRIRRPVSSASSSPTTNTATTSRSARRSGSTGSSTSIDPVLESAICIGQNPPPGGNELIFLGRYRPTSAPPAGFPATCPTRETKTTPLCRFEVIVRDNDGEPRPVAGRLLLDQAVERHGSRRLNSIPATVFYSRAGHARRAATSRSNDASRLRRKRART